MREWVIGARSWSRITSGLRINERISHNNSGREAHLRIRYDDPLKTNATGDMNAESLMMMGNEKKRNEAKKPNWE